MELWIRSQKGLTLKKVNELTVEHKAGENIYFITDGRYCVLGEYETNERALEVLGEIERAIKCICVVRDTNDEILNNILKEKDTKKFMTENLYIYHMPEE